MIMTRQLFHAAWRDYSVTMTAAAIILLAVITLTLAAEVGKICSKAVRLLLLVSQSAAFGLCASRRHYCRRAFPIIITELQFSIGAGLVFHGQARPNERVAAGYLPGVDIRLQPGRSRHSLATTGIALPVPTRNMPRQEGCGKGGYAQTASRAASRLAASSTCAWRFFIAEVDAAL